ncbi:olfactory receptor 2A14-like [Dendrobates tinctorius]|uniref:olfactory receptor 2A14-like n=1 Tax=Dendrobates tinctorius TaxID=92724 RepID=UPI003CC961E6
MEGQDGKLEHGTAAHYKEDKDIDYGQNHILYKPSIKSSFPANKQHYLCEHLMDNNTYTTFHILPFSSNTINKPLIAGIFSAIYLMGITLNSLVIALICLDVHLHTPMYLFFCNLSIIDICYTTVIIPKLLHILLSGNGVISFTQCFTQMYFYFTGASVEEILLFVMGFDRYVAICHPLSYHRILNKKTCVLIVVAIWISAFVNSSLFVCFLIKMTFNTIVTIKNIFCDSVDVFNTSGGDSGDFYILLYVELVLFGFFPLFCNFLSYVRIIRAILRMKSKEGRRKTFSTCLSHLIVMITYYSTGTVDYMMPFSDGTVTIKQILSALYTTVVPMVNPLIYSLRSSEILRAFQRLLRIK